MATYLLTGCAGFIASKVSDFLLADGHTVLGVDNLNDAYDLRLKEWWLGQVDGRPGSSSTSGTSHRGLAPCQRRVNVI